MSKSVASKLSIAVGSILLLSGCWGPMSEEEKAELQGQRAADAIAAASSPDSMWYRYTFEGDYQGEAVQLDQMVYCPIKSFSGGSLGQSTGFSIRAQHPMTVAQQMSDGSQVLVRIPDVCQRYRAYKEGEGYQQGWESPQSIDALPYVIWSDAYPDATRVEAYVSPVYYEQPEARLEISSSQVQLLPLGSHPDDFEDVLRQPHATPYAPNPWVEPENRGKGWRYNRGGSYYGPGNQFISFYQVPIVDLNAYARQFMIDRADLERDFVYDEESDFTDPNVAAFDEVSAPKSNLGGDPSATTHDCVTEALDEIFGGRPLITSVPYDRPDPGGFRTLSAEQSWYMRKQRESNCRDRLAQLRSFDIIAGRFDASRSIPGVLIYNRWGLVYYDWRSDEKQPKEVRYGPIKLQEMGLVTPDGYKMTVEGYRFDYKINGSPGASSNTAIFEIKESGQWYMVQNRAITFKGKGPVNHF